MGTASCLNENPVRIMIRATTEAQNATREVLGNIKKGELIFEEDTIRLLICSESTDGNSSGTLVPLSTSTLIDTKANILSTTPNRGSWALASDTDQAYLGDGSSWYEVPTAYSVRSTIDMGAQDDSSLAGYGVEYVTDKTLHNVVLLNSDRNEKGSLRTVVETDGTTSAEIMEVFLNGQWNKLPLDIVFIPVDGNYIHVVNSTGIEVMTGNSLNLDVNGMPLVQQYTIPMGALAVPRVVDGNI